VLFRNRKNEGAGGANVRVLVGLGNPGPNYVFTRHNAGFLVVDELARRLDATLKSERQAEQARVGAALAPGGAELLLLKPLTFMNLSGKAVQAALTRSRARPDALLVIHDDIDLPLGRLRFKQGGGAGGQRGVASIISAMGPEFLRLKVGVGRPPERWSTENWVLSRFRPEEEELVARVVHAAADAVEAYLTAGLETAMNEVNGVDLAATNA
jgi:PTH1 family peptidyl-tRNA hydrolase